MLTPRKVLAAGLIALLALPGASGSLQAGQPEGMITSVLSLEPEIDCPSCEDGIKHALVTAHGVRSANVDELTNRIVIVYDPTSINLKALIGRIRIFGYTATVVK